MGDDLVALDSFDSLPTVRLAPPRLASFEARLAAFLLDCLVWLTTFALAVAIGGFFLLFQSHFGKVDPPTRSLYAAVLMVIAQFPLYLIYVILGWTWYGQTLGKRIMMIRIVGPDGRPPGLGRVIVRLVGYALSTALLFAGFVIAGFDREHRALHDMLAGTRVQAEY